MTSTKWFAIGSFGISTVLAYLGGFAGSAFVERQLSTDSTPPEIVTAENPTSNQIRDPPNPIVGTPQTNDNMFKALSIEASLIRQRQGQNPLVP